MFEFFKKKPALPLCPANPGMGIEAKVAFSNGERSWSEEVNLVSLAATAFKSRGCQVANQKTWLLHSESGYMIQPQLVAIQPLEDGGVQTTTTVQCNHPTLVPDGVFEYQHSTGDNLDDSISKGLDQWLQTDFIPLLDAARLKPESCTMLEMTFPADDRPARVRRAILGPVAHVVQNPPARPEGNGSEEHPFCPCCLLTNSFEAFRELIEGDGFYGLRLFAMRSPEGAPEADCRVNGEDWERGAQALREYVHTWPEAGFEFRKQYVVLRSIDKSGA